VAVDAVSLSQADVVDVLSKAAAFDNRKPSRAAVMAWQEALALAGVTSRADALAAVSRHYASSSDYLGPAHLARQVEEIRRERRAQMPAPAELMADVDPNDPDWGQILTTRKQQYLAGAGSAPASITRGA
jgi:hypothetical protein